MNLSPADTADVKERIAQICAKAAMKEAGGAKGLVVFPIATVTQMTGLSRHTIPKRMPVTEATPGKFGVSLENLEAYLDGKTVWPGEERQKKREAGAGTPTPQK